MEAFQGLPWPAFTAAFGGWILVGMCVLGIFRGSLITRREAEGKDRELEAMREILATKDKTIADFTEATAASTAMIKAVLDVARERSP